MNNIQQTSLIAYENLCNDVLSRSRLEVLTLIRNLHGATNNELASKLGWEINRVTPRTNELVKLGEVMDSGIRRECFCDDCNSLRARFLPIKHKVGIVWVMKKRKC